ncbi:unnamed protein product [Rotaria socialis]|uniref:Uncharacterized protein n=1 Tax=Rotaria socialis TaxID=392032 RepID=A0A821I6T2_9BILA|nr:unnamed protein product [Rotaria socialis]
MIKGRNRITDGTCVPDDLLHVPQLHSFTFYISTSIDIGDLSQNLSHEHIQQTLINIGQQNANSIINNLVVTLNIPANAKWTQNGMIVAGGHRSDRVVADTYNHRIIQWKIDDTNGQVIAGDNGQGNRLNQLDQPTDVLLDKYTDSLIICDPGNRRVVQWPRRTGTTQGKILIDNIACWGLTMYDHKYFYMSDTENNAVIRYQIGNKNRTIRTSEQGASLNQLNFPTYPFVNQEQTVYVSDNGNHPVNKWTIYAKEGIIVAGI